MVATNPGAAIGPAAVSEAAQTGAHEPSWRIDDLSHRAGVTVDTIRFYQREGLLPAPVRSGRNKLYGPAHLERLDRIRDLQARRFSLAAIRAVMEDDGGAVLDQLFGTERPSAYSRAELAERSGLSTELIDAFAAVGLVPEPSEIGHEAYDASDVRGLHAAGELVRGGIPSDVLLELAATYVRHFEAMQQDVVRLFTGQGDRNWDADELAAMQSKMAESAGWLLPHVERLLHYVHQRTLQRTTLEVIRTGPLPGVIPGSE